MELATITMERPAARQAFLEYRKAVRERHDEEDAQIMRGYRSLALGKQLIHLGDTIRVGGLIKRTWTSWNGDRTAEVDLPALAVMRADRTECFVSRLVDGGCVFTPDRWYRGRRDRIVVNGMDLGPHYGSWKAMVPIVPAGLRPKLHLRNYHVLWEADWHQDVAPAPRDPALLKRIGGELFAVVALWDLTELERAVLSARNE